MPVNKAELKLALSTFHEENGELYCSSQFINLLADIRLTQDKIHNAGRIISNLCYLIEDYFILETLIARLSEQKRLCNQGQLPQTLWMLYASCDIELFHVTLRSLFDYLARMIRSMAETPDVGPESFEQYRNWANRSPTNTKKVGPGFTRIMNDCKWFTDIRASRTTIVHDGGHTLVFPEPNRILFQIDAGARNAVFIPELMFNPNIVDFEKYGGMLFGYVIAYLESFASFVHKRLKLKRAGVGDAKHQHFGNAVIKEWIQMAYNA
jgi:hypothetical protein